MSSIQNDENETKNEDIDIPSNIKKYEKIVIHIEKNVEVIVNNIIDGFQGNDLMVIIVELGSVFMNVKSIINDTKKVDSDDKITIYNIILVNIMKRIIERSDKLNEEQKQFIRNYFSENGIVNTILNKIRDTYQQQLEKMDVNGDDLVSKEEFYNSIKTSCCNNEGCAKCFVGCCFPFLSGGKDHIEVDTN
jgi:hypothetical protein